jgi:cytochrome c2
MNASPVMSVRARWRVPWFRLRRRFLFGWVGLVALSFAAGLLVAAATPSGVLEGSPFRGRTLFVDKLCDQCHSIWGHGGTTGPEISRVIAGKALPQLTGEFWNHTPRMMDEMAGKGYAWPTMDHQEMADLLSYLYYLRLFDDPGKAAEGAATFARLRCESCHSLGGKGGTVGAPLDGFAAYASPLPLAQSMWNAGPAMQRAQTAHGAAIPKFSGGEMADIQAYIRERGRLTGDRRVHLLPLPDPAEGEKVFVAKRCAACHATRRAGAPDLAEAALRLTVAEISGVLWNHSYAMQDRMRAVGIPFPRFQGRELSDLISYLHLLGYRGREGDARRGAKVFEEKGCAACHGDSRTRAPDLARSRSVDDAVALSAAMWNHAPQMYRVMADRGVPWPQFEAGDVEDLVAYLRRPSVGSEASGRAAPDRVTSTAVRAAPSPSGR